MATVINTSAGDPASIVAYCNARTAAVNAFLIQLGELAAGLAAPTIEPLFPVPQDSPPLTVLTPPSMDAIVWVAPAIPAAFTEVLVVDDVMPAPFDEVPPALVFGTPPTFNEPIPIAPGVNTTFVMPELVMNLPAPPVLLSINIQPFEGMNLPPPLTLDIPELTIQPPSIREYVPGEDYTSALLIDLQERLSTNLEGGTGLSPEVENAIWDRGREREARSARDALLQIDEMETMGFMLPPGVYLDARLKLTTEMDYVNRGHSREVMIKAAELEQANVQHAITSAIQLESAMIQYANNVEQRMFESMRYATEAGVAIFNARVQAYGILMEAIKARVLVYDAQIRAEMAKVEAYKAEVEAEQAKAMTNRSIVESYSVQVTAAMSAVEIYKAQIFAIQAQADIEKTKIEIFGEQVRAYAAQVQAYTAGVEGFRATIQAEATKQDAYKSQVQAYAAQVDAAARQIEARIAAYKSRIDAKSAEYDGYKATIMAETARVNAIAEVNKSRSTTYEAEVRGISSYNEVLTKQWEAAIEQAARVAEIGIGTAKANAELYITTRTLAVEAAKTGATVSAQLGAAALNAINWSNTYSSSYSQSTSDSESTIESTSSSESTSTNYNYSV